MVGIWNRYDCASQWPCMDNNQDKRGHRDHALGGTSPGSLPHLLQALAATGEELGIESCSWLQATQGAMGRDQNVWWRWLTWCRRVLAHISVLPTPGAAKERPERPSWSACPPFLLLCWFLHHVLYLGALVILGKVNHLLSSCRRRRWSVTPIHVCAVEDRVRSLLVSHGPTSHSLRYLLRQLYELEGKSHISFLQVVYTFCTDGVVKLLEVPFLYILLAC